MSKLEDVIKNKLNSQQFDGAATGWAGLETMLNEQGKAAAGATGSAVKAGLGIKLWLSGLVVAIISGSALLWWNFDEKNNNVDVAQESIKVSDVEDTEEKLVASINPINNYETSKASSLTKNKLSASHTITNEKSGKNTRDKITGNNFRSSVSAMEGGPDKISSQKRKRSSSKQPLYNTEIGERSSKKNAKISNGADVSGEDLFSVEKMENTQANSTNRTETDNRFNNSSKSTNSIQNNENTFTEIVEKQDGDVPIPPYINEEDDFSENNSELLAMVPKQKEEDKMDELYTASINNTGIANTGVTSDFEMSFEPEFMDQLLLDEIPYESKMNLAHKPATHGPKKIDLPLILSIHGGGMVINSIEDGRKEKAQLGFNFGAEVYYSKGSWLLGTGVNYYQQSSSKDLSYFTTVDKSYWDINHIEYTIITDNNYVQENDKIITYWSEDLNAVTTDTITTYEYVVDGIDTVEVQKADTLGYVNQIDSSTNKFSLAATNYLELPFIIGYEFPINRFSLQLTSGIGVGLLTTKSVTPVNSEVITVKSHNKILLNYLFRLGVLYHLNDYISLKIEPHFRTNLNNGLDNSKDRLKHKSYGLNLGVSWRF